MERNKKGQFIKGMIPWNKGKFATQETIEKLKLSHVGQIGSFKGKHHTAESKLKISLALKGKIGRVKDKSKHVRSELKKKISVNREFKCSEYKDEIIEMYNKGISAIEISKRLPTKVSYASIFTFLRKSGILIRDKGFKKGKDNPSWNNGISNHCGYVMVSNTTHPRARGGFIEEHVLIMENKIGRMLKKGEVVHHVNRNKQDNRPDNLMLFKNRKEHTQYHWDNKELRFDYKLKDSIGLDAGSFARTPEQIKMIYDSI